MLDGLTAGDLGTAGLVVVLVLVFVDMLLRRILPYMHAKKNGGIMERRADLRADQNETNRLLAQQVEILRGIFDAQPNREKVEKMADQVGDMHLFFARPDPANPDKNLYSVIVDLDKHIQRHMK